MRVSPITGKPVLDWEVDEEIVAYFAEYGRTVKTEFIPHLNCWVAMVSLRTNDPTLEAWQQGRTEREPTEDVIFHEPNPLAGQIVQGRRQPPFVALDLNSMGRLGVREFLERGNTFSGTGEFASIAEAARASDERGTAGQEKIRRDAKNDAVDMAMEVRRQVEKIPFHRVGIDLSRENAA